MIEIRDISKKYRETFVLRHVSTRLPSDRMVAFIGSNGAGKSTMLNIISRLLEPTEGSVSIDGRELRKWDSRELAKTLTILGQTLHTPARLTVEELVRFGRFPHSRGRWKIRIFCKSKRLWNLPRFPICAIATLMSFRAARGRWPILPWPLHRTQSTSFSMNL